MTQSQTQLTTDDVRHIAKLAAMRVDDAKLEEMRRQLSDILTHFQRLQEIDTEGLEPTSHTTDANTVLRDDEVTEGLDRDAILTNAPDPDGEFVRVRPVLD